MPNAEYEKQWGKGPHITVDAVVYWWDKYLLIRRKDNGKWALPGGFIEPSERAVEAAIRELREETGIETKYKQSFEFVDQFIQDDPDRDPRSHIITIVNVFMIKGRGEIMLNAGDDAIDAQFIHKKKILKMIDQKLLYADHGDSILKAHRILLKERL